MNTRHLFFGLVLLGLITASPLASRAQSIPNNLTPTNDTGVQPYQTYGGVRENINLMNGNVNLQVPLLTLPGRNGHDLVVNLNYDSKIWQLHHQYIPDPGQDLLWWDYEVNVPRIGDAGWRLGVPLLQATLRNMTGSEVRCYTDFVITLSDGSKHVFRNRAACFRINNPNPPPPPQGGSCPTGTLLQQPSQNVPVTTSQDAAFLLLDTTNPADVVLHLKDGTRIHFYTDFGQGPGCEAIPYLKIADKEVDTDGNIVTIQSSGDLDQARVDLITDTLGRTVTFSYAGNPTLSYKDSSGQTRTVTLTYQAFNMAPTFSQPLAQVPAPGAINLLGTIALPNGLRYAFEYNSWGELTKATYPTGGYTGYDYAPSVSLWLYRNDFGVTEYSTPGDFREVAARRVCSSASGSCGSEEKTTYTPTITSAQEHNQFMDLCDPEQNRSRSEFVDKREVTRWAYQGGCSNGQPVGGTVLRTIQTEYVAAGSFSFAYGYDKIPSRITTTLNDSGQVSRVEYDYDTWSYGSVIDNPIETREFDFGAGVPGPLARKTVNTWLKVNPVNSQNYWSAAIYVVDRKASEKVYDGAGALKAQTDFEYDNYTEGLTSVGAVQREAGFGTSYTTRGNLTAVLRWRNSPAATLTTRNQYDEAGNVRKTTDPGGHAATFEYWDSWGNATCAPSGGAGAAYLTRTTNALGHVATSSYNSCSGTVATTTDPNSRTTSFSYDLMGRVTVTNFPDSGQTSRTYNESYPVPASGLSVTTTTKITTSMNAVGTVVVDGLGRVTKSCLDSDPEGQVCTDTTFDSLGRKKTVSNPHRTSPSPTDGTTEFQYDALSRVAKVIPPDGTSSSNNVSTAYSGNCTTVTDQAGKQRKSCTDALGRLTQVYEPNASGALVNLTSYTYDVLDNLLTVVQSGSRNRTFVYNSLSQLTSATNPESGTVTYGYDNDGNLLTKLDARNLTTTHTYDALHRLTGKSFSNGEAAFGFLYDESVVWGVPVENPVGRLVRAHRCFSGPYCNVGTIFSYDALGRPKFLYHINQFQTPNPYNNQIFNYTYNLDGSVASITYPSGRVVTYTPNAAGRTVSAVDVANGVNYATLGLYAPHGALSSIKHGVTGTFTGITETNSYNKRLQPSILSAATTTNTVLSFSYNFDLGVANNGNVKQIINNLNNNRTQSFTYDELNRVKTAQTQATTGSLCWGQTFSYDIWANLLSIGGQTGYGACTQQVLSLGEATPQNRVSGNTYDAAGNMTNAPGMGSYTYDAENRMLTAGGVSYTYDAQGERVMKSTGTLYWHGLGGEVLLETNNSGGNPTEYIFFNGQRIARRDPSGAVFYFFGDHLGSSRIVTNATGGVVEDSDFYPFGGERVIVDSLNNNYKFTGKERDSESGLDYFIARHYASNLGRFLQPDPMSVLDKQLANPQDLNLYTYTINNPLRYQDPNGADWRDVGTGILEGTANFATNVAVLATYSIASVTPVGGVIGAQRTLVEGTVDSATTAVSAYANDGVSGVANQVLDQGEQGATAIVTEAVGWGALAASSTVNSVLPKTSPKAVPTAPGVQANRAAGLEFEGQALRSEGLAKNTRPVQAVDPKTGKPGTTIPDAIRSNGQTVDAKAGRRVSDTPQLRRQSQASEQAGQTAQLIVKKGAKVSKTVRGRMSVKEE